MCWTMKPLSKDWTLLFLRHHYVIEASGAHTTNLNPPPQKNAPRSQGSTHERLDLHILYSKEKLISFSVVFYQSLHFSYVTSLPF